MNRVIRLSLLLILTTPVFCEETPEAILRESYLMSKVPHVIMKINMTIHTRSGIKNRTLKVYVKHQGESLKLLMHVVSPAFLQKMKFLIHHFEDGVENKWLRTSRGVRQLSESQRADRLFDSDFTVEDLSEVEVSEFALKRLESQILNGHECDVVEMTPRRESGEYQKKIVKVDRLSGIIREVEIFGTGEELIKRYTLDETLMKNASIFPLSCSMQNLSRGTKTILHFVQIDVATDLAESVFNKGNL